DSQCPAMALLAPIRPGFWQTFQPSQAPLGLLVFGSQDGVNATIDLVRALPGYALQMAVLQQDPDFSAIPRATDRSPFEFVEYIQTGSLALQGTFEQFWMSRSDDLKRNNARRRRKLVEEGHTLEFVAHTDPTSVASCIQEYGRLETQGWKGQRG